MLNAATGPCKGKGSDEQTLIRGMLDTLKADDILLGDAFYPTYFLLCALVERGIDGVFEQHGGWWKGHGDAFLDADVAPKNELKALYQRRWNVELGLRNIKTTLGMERLRCKRSQG